MLRPLRAGAMPLGNAVLIWPARKQIHQGRRVGNAHDGFIADHATKVMHLSLRDQNEGYVAALTCQNIIYYLKYHIES